MKAEIIAVGTELLMGQISNTNAQYISQKLPGVGVGVYYHSVVGDNPERLKDTLKRAMSRCEVVILTGGLGPTQDDLTKETVAGCFGLDMIYDETSAKNINEYFTQLGKEMVASNLKQAYFPEGSKILYNDKGTAPGCIVETENNIVVMLPGPPKEMIPMFEKWVEPYFGAKCTEKLTSAFIKITGIGESKVEDALMPFIDSQTNPTFATYAKTGDVTLRITAAAKTAQESQSILDKAVCGVKNILGDCVYSIDNEELESVIIKKFAGQGKTLATAESCTGGLLSRRLTSVPGASSVIGFGFITYSNEAKVKLLGVKSEILDKYGEVSAETASEMCLGLKNISGASICVSITGIAGPGGGTDDKPVGLVYIGIMTDGPPEVIECHFNGNRERIRTLTVAKVLEELLKV